jgi:hypothetical protein
MSEAALALLTASAYVAVMLLLSIPVHLEGLLLALLALMVLGAVLGNIPVVEAGFSATYLVLVAYAAYSQASVTGVVLLALLALVLRDALHVLARGKALGLTRLLAHHLPLYTSAVAALACAELLRENPPSWGTTALVLSAALTILVSTWFLSAPRRGS